MYLYVPTLVKYYNNVYDVDMPPIEQSVILINLYSTYIYNYNFLKRIFNSVLKYLTLEFIINNFQGCIS